MPVQQQQHKRQHKVLEKGTCSEIRTVDLEESFESETSKATKKSSSAESDTNFRPVCNIWIISIILTLITLTQAKNMISLKSEKKNIINELCVWKLKRN